MRSSTATQTVSGIEELGKETVNGINTTHYRIVTKYQDHYGDQAPPIQVPPADARVLG